MKPLLLAAAVALVIVFLALPWLVGISPLHLRDALAVGTGITAKLACSGRYLSGFNEAQNLADVATYSPAFPSVTLRHTGPASYRADIGGLAVATARYYPGLGCTLQFPGMAALENLQVPVLPQRHGPWPRGEEVGAGEAAVQARLDRILAEDESEGLDTRALLVVRDGRIVGEAYRQGIEAETPLLGWSMGKSVSAILLGRMEAMGLVDVAETRLFASWANDARSQISLQDLLQMSSGLDFEEPYLPGSDSTRMLFMVASAAAVALESPLAHEPGTYFYYSSGTSNLLTRLAWERLGGDTQALLDFFAREIAVPLGLGNTTVELDASGVFVGSSYVYAPARDWARLGLLMLNDGVAGEQRLLPEGWVERASRPNRSVNEPRYGYQFWLNGGGTDLRWPDLGAGAYAMMGNRGQVVMILPAKNALVVRLGWTGAGDYPYNDRIARVVAALDQVW